MKRFRLFSLAAIAAVSMALTVPSARAQVSFGVQIGSPPACPYGYFDYPPYNCAPFGYYGPQWFSNGVFIGAGPWFRGPRDFDGWVDRHYDPRDGYRGELPRRGERPDWDRHRGWEQHFHGDYQRHEMRGENGGHYNQYDNRGGGHDNGNRGQYENRGGGHDNGNHGQYDNRGGGHDNGHGNNHDNNHDNGRGHDDNGH